jgi:hypothetical protein
VAYKGISNASRIDTYSAVGPLVVSGCSQSVVPEPGRITLREAMKEVPFGFNDMFEIRKNTPKTGIFPSTITIVCNISARPTDQGQPVVGAGATPADVLKIGKAETEASSTITASRGDTVTLEFANLRSLQLRFSQQSESRKA